MTRKMIVNAMDQDEVRIAILDERRLQDFDIETRSVEKNKGNIYKGVVMAVEPALNAAFVNYGADKQGFLTANDVHPKYARARNDGKETAARAGQPKIGELLKPKQTVLVQVSKDEVSTKGAVLTTYLSLAGRYLVLMPDSETQAISRKIDDEETRRRVREAAAKLLVPEKMGVIIRTAGRDRTRLELNRDLRVLLRLWTNIQREANRLKAPALIFKEQDVIIRALRDYFSPDIDEIVLDSDEAYDRAAEYVHMVMPNQRSVLTRYVERRPIFNHYRIEEQLDIIYTPRVTLPSGGSIVIESTEALVAIDVNSGKQKSSNQEETATQTNIEAAREAARQLRLRDLGGIIVIDFIDMASRKNQLRVERALKEGLSSDKARIKIGKISRNGTLELTRQRLRSALNTSVFDRCRTCNGTGHTLNPSSHALAVLRKLRDRASRGDLQSAKVRVEPEVANRLRTELWHAVQDCEKRFNVRLDIVAEHTFGASQDDYTFVTDPQAEVLAPSEPNFGPAPKPEYEGDEEVEDNLWADDDMDVDELRALEALDREDARLAEAALRGENDDEDVLPVLSKKKRRRSSTPRESVRERRAPRAAAGEGESDSLEMPTYKLIEPRRVARQSRRRAQQGQKAAAGADGVAPPALQRKKAVMPEIIDAVVLLQNTPAHLLMSKATQQMSWWRRLLRLIKNG